MARKPKMRESVPDMWRVLRGFWPWIRVERTLIASSMAAMFAGVLLRLAEPWPLKFVLDRIIPTSGPTPHTPTWISSMKPMTVLTLAAVSVVALSGVRAVFDYLNKIGFSKIAVRVLRQVRSDVYTHLQQLSLSFHTKSRTGDLIVRITRDVGMLRDVASIALFPLVASVFVLAGMGTIMVLLEWRLAALTMVTVPAFWFTTARLTKKIHRVARKQRAREGAMAATAVESIGAIRDVQAMSLEGTFAQDFVSRNAQSQKQDLQGARLSAKLGRTIQVLLAVATALVMWSGAVLVLRGRISPGDLIVFLTYLRRAFQPVKDFAKYTGRLAKAAASGERVLAVLAEEPEIRDKPDAIVASQLEGSVRFDNVSFDYEPGKRVLEGISFQADAGAFVAVTGPSGVGKSTLASLLLRLYDPTSGRLLFDGHDARDYTVASLRARISVVLQDAILFATSAGENISFGVPDATPAQVEAAARLANAHDFIMELPDGYETAVGERGATLSRGQRQRISVARAAMRPTPILILDEPTTGLDEENDRELRTALQRLAQGRTTFLITHDLKLASVADLVVHLGRGRVLEQGTPAELMSAGGQFAELYRLQSDWGLAGNG